MNCCSTRNSKSRSDLVRQAGKDVLIVFLAFADLNQALAAKQIDAMNQSEPQSSQALNKNSALKS